MNYLLENFLIQSVGELLTSNHHPVIVLDFGSTQAYSLARIARKFEEQVANGELILVASNLSYKPSEEEELKVKDELEGVSVKEMNKRAIPEYYKYANMIVWVNGRAEDLTTMSVKGVGGETYPLLGAVSLINECSVLRHVGVDNESPENTRDEKMRSAASSLRALLSDNGLLISTDLAKELGDETPDPQIFDREIISNGDGVELIKKFQSKIFMRYEQKIREGIELARLEIKNGSIPGGFNEEDLDMLNESREKRIKKFEKMLVN